MFELRSQPPSKSTGIATEGLFHYTQADRKLVPLLLPGITASPGYGTFESAGMRPTLNNAEILSSLALCTSRRACPCHKTWERVSS